ncbi:MAG: hypothetical protein FWG71_00655 [Synergistaceae bacterium]|nr:hypothetical protein [Synergistaceae bacterium]
MAIKKNVEAQSGTSILGISSSSDVLRRVEKISKRTGMSSFNLLQKWVLQEEFLIGVMQGQSGGLIKFTEGRQDKTPAPKQRKETPPPKTAKDKSAKTKRSKPDNQGYRKEIAQRVKKLKKEGMTLKKITDLFNDEKVPTVSGKGKWYSSSINNLLGLNK